MNSWLGLDSHLSGLQQGEVQGQGGRGASTRARRACEAEGLERTSLAGRLSEISKPDLCQDLSGSLPGLQLQISIWVFLFVCFFGLEFQDRLILG